MKSLTALIAAVVFAMGIMANAPDAEARRRGYGSGNVVAGIVAAAIVGGIVAASLRKQRRNYAYYRQPAYAYAPSYYYGSSYGYARPTYVYRAPVHRAPVYRAPAYHAPVYAYRPARVYHRPVVVHRAGFGGGRRAFHGRRR